MFPKDGSQFRMSQLETLWSLFGLPAPVLPVGRLIGRVGEMIDNRNRIAHGEDTAEDVGRRYTIAEIRDRVDDTEALCSHLNTAIAAYLRTPTGAVVLENRLIGLGQKVLDGCGWSLNLNRLFSRRRGPRYRPSVRNGSAGKSAPLTRLTSGQSRNA